MQKSTTYTIAPRGESITCHFCGLTSYNLGDVSNLYCGRCHIFHTVEPQPIGNPLDADFAFALQVRFPEIPWREPISVSVASQPARLVCRICIARHGLRGQEVKLWPDTLADFQKHLLEKHPLS